MATVDVHRIAQAGFGEGTNELYDRFRLFILPLFIYLVKHTTELGHPIQMMP